MGNPDAWDGASFKTNGMFPCGGFFSYGNSMFLQSSTTNWDSNGANITRNGSAQGKPKQIVDIQPNNTFAWPGPGVEIGSHVYIQTGEGNGLNATNQSLWDLTQSTGTLWTATRTTPANMSGQTNILYSTGMVKGIDGYVYCFGSQSTGFGYASDIFVARFPQSNPQSWTFWNGSSWASTPVTGTTARIADALGSSSLSFANGKWVLMTMDQGFNCDATRNIYISTATTVTGPYSARTKVYTIKEYINGNYARYYTPVYILNMLTAVTSFCLPIALTMTPADKDRALAATSTHIFIV
jgi:hypothetical protein